MRLPVKMLTLSEIKFVKQINIVSTNTFDRESTIGFIIYERNFSLDYKFNINEEGERHFLEPYPKQEEFPQDSIDDLIIQTVQQKFPNSNVFNHFIVFSSDVDYIDNLKSRPFEKAKLEIALGRMDMLAKPPICDFEMMSSDVNVYVESSSEKIKDLVFYSRFNTNDRQQLWQQLQKIKFL